MGGGLWLGLVSEGNNRNNQQYHSIPCFISVNNALYAILPNRLFYAHEPGGVGWYLCFSKSIPGIFALGCSSRNPRVGRPKHNPACVRTRCPPWSFFCRSATCPKKPTVTTNFPPLYHRIPKYGDRIEACSRCNGIQQLCTSTTVLQRTVPYPGNGTDMNFLVDRVGSVLSCLPHLLANEINAGGGKIVLLTPFVFILGLFDKRLRQKFMQRWFSIQADRLTRA